MQTFKVTILISLVAMPVSAQDLSYQISGSAGSFSNQYGGFGVSQLRGIGDSYDRDFVDLSFSVAKESGNGDTFVVAYSRSQFDVFSRFSEDQIHLMNNGITQSIVANDKETDATTFTHDVTFRYLRDRNGYTFGGFAGVGIHNDYGDLDAEMGYAFVGAEVSRETQFGGVYAQAGMIDATDNIWMEGIQDAPFVNVGGRYELENGFTLTGSLAYAGGTTGLESNYTNPKSLILVDNNLFNARIGLERDFGNITGSVGYEVTHMNTVSPKNSSRFFVTDRRFGDTFEQFYVGFNYEFGATANHGSPLPSFGNWVAFAENEVEMPVW